MRPRACVHQYANQLGLLPRDQLSDPLAGQASYLAQQGKARTGRMSLPQSLVQPLPLGL
jgi:hypothetical protein